MATITRSYLETYQDQLEALSLAAKKIINLQTNQYSKFDYVSLHNQTQEWFEDLAQLLSDSAAQISLDGYNAIRLKELGEELELEISELEGIRNAEATDKALWAISSQAENNLEKFNNLLSSRASFETKRSAGRAMQQIGYKDPNRPRYARVPGMSKTYGHGCPFCIMLASRGFVYLSAKSAGAYDHYHADCRCSIVPSWDKANPKVQGYDPDKYLAEYQENKKNQGSSTQGTTKSNRSKKKFANYAELKNYLLDANSKADLEKRSAVIDKEWASMKLDKAYVENIRHAYQYMLNKLSE